MLICSFKAGGPLGHKFEWLAHTWLLVSFFLTSKMVTNDPNSLLIMDQSAFGLDLLKEGGNLKVGIEVLRIQL